MPTEFIMLRLWREGRKDAGEWLYTRFNRSVLRFLISKTRDRSEAEDLLHETFITLRTMSSQSASEDDAHEVPFQAFILAVACNVLRNHLRKVGRRLRRELDFSKDSLADVQPGLSSIVDARQQANGLMEALRSVSIDDQIILELKYFEDLTLQQIAWSLGIPQSCMNGRLSRAKQRLSAKLNERTGGKESDDAWRALGRWIAEIRVALVEHTKPHTGHA